MNIGKVLGIGCLGVIALVGLIIGIVFYATSGITDTADGFFAAANEGDYAEAYSMTSQQLQRQLSEEELQEFMAGNGLDSVTDTSWASRSINNNRGELSGTATTATGGSIPLEMELIQEGDDWKIVFIDVGAAGVSGGD